MSGLTSRIPKLYGGKRTPQTNEIPSRESTPVNHHDERGTSKSTPTTGGVPVSRSRSLKLPRKQYGGGVLGSSSTSRLESKRHQGANGRPGVKDPSSSPDSSASSPGNTTATNHAHFTSSTEVSGTDSDLTKSGSENPFLRRRAQSFGPNLRRPVNNRHLRPPGNWSRENTPVGSRGNTPTPRSVTPSSYLAPSSRRGRRGEGGGVSSGTATPTGHRHLRSRSSLGNSAAMVTEEDSAHSSGKQRRMRRTDSNDVLDGSGEGWAGRGREGGTKGNPHGRRPNSYIMQEPADLNQLAHEITSSMDYNASLDTPEVKSVARIHSSTTTSGKMGVVSTSHTPSSSGYSGCGMSSKTRSTSSEKLTQLGRGTKYNFTTKTTPPESGGSKIRTPRGSLNSRSSTPSSGRSTPVGVGGERRSKISPPAGDQTPSGGSRLPAPVSTSRWSQRKVIRVREPRPVGINELEGAVLMDSDEYLKISHEVKALKTAILKLKRELQSGEQPGEGGHVTDPGSAHSVGKTPRRPPGGQVTDGDRIKTLATEKARVVSENDQLKKKLKATSDRLEKMTSDLKNSEEEKKKMSDRLQQVETHRDLLLDKVERLHADKHKLEDRLRSLEKAQLYEESSSGWLEEGGEGGEGKWEETLMLGDGKGEKTESDVGVSGWYTKHQHSLTHSLMTLTTRIRNQNALQCATVSAREVT